MIGYVNSLPRRQEKQIEAKAVIDKEGVVLSARIEGCLVILVVWTMLLFLSLHRHDYGMVLFFLSPSQSQSRLA